jgi:hypothetical protein
MTKIKNEDLIWVRQDIKFDGDYVAGSKLPAVEKPPTKARGGKRSRDRAPQGDYTVAQLAAEWGFSTDKIRELFRNEPGVLKLKDENAAKKRKRSYVTLRIPPEVAQRVKRRLS